MAKKKTVPIEITPGDMAPYLFHQGTNFHTQNYLGCHRTESGYVFRTWAPNAYSVSLVSDFTGWGEGLSLYRVTEMGVWEVKVEAADLEGKPYKYRIQGANGVRYKADPYAAMNETLQKTASLVYTKDDFRWTDGTWMNKRRRLSHSREFYSAPLHIYEMHLASWRTRDGKTNVDGDAYLNYREIADLLVPYVKKMGYTHVELLPIGEYPFDGSWGYQCCGYFSPTSRYGTPEDFRYFVNKLHSNGIGVILDWVPAHFPKDEHGLYEFDGSPLYEYQGWDRQEHTEWGTRCFDVGRPEVQSFLISSALYWIEQFHLDGLRVDAVASMLYLDYARKPGEWVPNVHGGRENLEAIAFFQKLNSALFGAHGDILMIAEESTSWAAITKPVYQGGLGFNFKWNMGWANDMYEYVELDPIVRQHHHNKLNFSLCYAFSENYILPVSHDEVVHGKKSLLDKMWGGYEQKFAGDRLFMAYQMTHPGKKLTFMGCEFGQFREWDYENQLEWFMTDYEMHGRLWHFSETLNNFYLSHKALWEDDFSWGGFEWIWADQKEDNLIAYTRKGRSGESLICVLNFGGAPRENYPIPVPEDAEAYREVLSTDDVAFGGEGRLNSGLLRPAPDFALDGKRTLRITIPPLSAVILEPKKLPGRKKG